VKTMSLDTGFYIAAAIYVPLGSGNREQTTRVTRHCARCYRHCRLRGRRYGCKGTSRVAGRPFYSALIGLRWEGGNAFLLDQGSTLQTD
jgi:hypothetical protein